jgi:hypothetical protein
MPDRPFKCEKCSKTFRTPTGREWHIARQHDTPSTLESLHAEYNENKNQMLVRNQALQYRNQEIQTALLTEKMRLVTKQIDAIESTAECQRLKDEKEKLMLALAWAATGTSQIRSIPAGTSG